MPSETDRPRLAVIGGTGPAGRGLTLRFAALSFPVICGSRSRERGREVAEELRSTLGDVSIEGASNLDAARQGDIVLLTIPYEGMADTLPPLREACTGKIVISAIVPIEWREGKPIALRPEAGSAAEEAALLLPGARTTSAFQTIDAHQSGNLDYRLDTDVLVASDDREARREVVRIAGLLDGVRALSAGRLSSSRYVEEVTALLITVNRIHRVHSGFRLTGIEA